MKQINRSAACAVAAAAALSVQASAVEWTETYYVEIITDHMSPQTAHLYDPVTNPNFDPALVTPACWNGATSAIPMQANAWFRGVNFRVVARTTAGQLIDVTSSAPYTEMNHHAVMTFYSYGPDMTCNPGPGSDDYAHNIVACGSELVNYTLPAGYGYDVSGLDFGGAAWHWHNSSHMHMHGQRVFIEMAITLSDDPGLVPVANVWIGESFGLCVPPGVSCTRSPDYGPYNTNGRWVLGVPHVHDHCTKLELRTTGLIEDFDLLVHDATPVNSLVHPVSHDACTPLPSTNFTCGVVQSIPPQEQHWHVHGSGSGHLPVGGLTAWVPGPTEGFFGPNDLFHTIAEFDNPHPTDIDNMVIFIMFAEVIP